jgi:two-component system chemotaxis sensor kinase CheA
LEDYRAFFITQNFIVTSKLPQDNLLTLYRQIHTFKGLFVQKEFIHTVKALHELESILSQLKINSNTSNIQLQELIKEFQYEEYIQKDMKILKKILGDDFFNKKGNLSIKEKDLLTIENRVESLMDDDDSLELIKLYRALKNLHLKPLKDLLIGYSKTVEQIALKLEKSINPLVLEIEENIKVSDEFKPFIKSLIHIFRNSADHGIEDIGERLMVNKEPNGTIKCIATKVDNTLILTISDDGRGITLDKIKQKAINLGLYSQKELDNFDENFILNLIFNDNFSTKDEVSEISGRGVGLSATKDECQKLGGNIKIENKIGLGCKFIFEIPNVFE